MATDMVPMGQHGAAKSSIAQAAQQGLAGWPIWSIQLLLGGDVASRYPARLAAAMLSKAGVGVEDWLHKTATCCLMVKRKLNHLHQLQERHRRGSNTSCGRVLDAVSALLGLCDTRSYEGEPAMKLESAALSGRDVLELEPQIYGNILGTSYLLKSIYESLGKVSVANLSVFRPCLLG